MQKRKKSRVRRELRSWKNKEESGQRYREAKKKYKRICEKKRREKLEGWEKEVEKARDEAHVWKIINRERKRRKGIKEEIEMIKWDKHFREQLRQSRIGG